MLILVLQRRFFKLILVLQRRFSMLTPAHKEHTYCHVHFSRLLSS